ncbi:MAG: YbhB/YbcL family Raf kinase inhibitor-like protein [Deltaproteobacteria bacterium]|nr:YbhB/YbcL family Raf kinase inhibitor-like protein [Deltaproteobacteria bacterium]
MLPVVFELSSTAFTQGATIPARHTCTGDDLSPPLSWTAPPEGTASLALVVDDPDAPRRTWQHWLVWNIPPTTRQLGEALGLDQHVQGTNDFKKLGYGGPCPPPGHGAHRYFFRLYALDVMLGLPAGASRAELDAAIKGHVIASAELMGKSWR